MARSRFVGHDGVRIHYLDSGGDDQGAPIVFVPGMTDVADDYTEVLATFGRRIVVVEVRGHGRSDTPAEGYELETIAGDVGTVVDDLTDGPVHVVTFSRGTAAALYWATNNPARVRSVAIGDYPPVELVPPPGATELLLTGTWRGTPVTDRVTETAVRATFAAARSRSFREPLAELAVPLLVVRSGEDMPLSDELWAQYRRHFPDAELVHLPDAPHDIFRPDRHHYPTLVRMHVDRADAVTT